MSYFLIGTNSSQLNAFIERHSLLSGSEVITSLADLQKVSKKFNSSTVVFIDLSFNQDEVEHFALVLRDSFPSVKIIYLISSKNNLDIAFHQTTPLGGDGYIYINTSTEVLRLTIESVLEKIKQDSAYAILISMKNSPESRGLDQIFETYIQQEKSVSKLQDISKLNSVGIGMSTNDKELSLEDMGEIELGNDSLSSESPAIDEGLDLNLDSNEGLSLDDSLNGNQENSVDTGLDLDFADGEGVELADIGTSQLNLSENASESFKELDLDNSVGLNNEVSVDSDLSLSDNEDDDLSLHLGDDTTNNEAVNDLSDDAKEKLKEIDAILDLDASQSFQLNNVSKTDEENEENIQDPDLNEPLVSNDLDLAKIDVDFAVEKVEEKPKQQTLMKKVGTEKADNQVSTVDTQAFKEISQAYSGELERTQATIANLRTDREELLKKIQNLEEEKMIQNRQVLTLRAELDEKKIELTILRKKNNDEMSDLKDKIRLFDEKKLIWEEKNKLLQQEIEKVSHKNKMDLKRNQLNERELEQKLELLKADAETQIRNRDLKILELKRKIDAMEFDMESISNQEKRSVESRYELEDKLEKAIKTLRSAITVLEDEGERGVALDALKKNIDM